MLFVIDVVHNVVVRLFLSMTCSDLPPSSHRARSSPLRIGVRGLEGFLTQRTKQYDRSAEADVIMMSSEVGVDLDLCEQGKKNRMR